MLCVGEVGMTACKGGWAADGLAWVAAISPGTLRDPRPSRTDLRRCTTNLLNKVFVLLKVSKQHMWQEIPSLLILSVWLDRWQTGPGFGPGASTSSSFAFSHCQPPHSSGGEVPRQSHKTQTATSATVEGVQQLRPRRRRVAGMLSLKNWI